MIESDARIVADLVDKQLESFMLLVEARLAGAEAKLEARTSKLAKDVAAFGDLAPQIAKVLNDTMAKRLAPLQARLAKVEDKQ